MESIGNLVLSIIKLPFIAFTKTLITGLNLIPTKVKPVHGTGGYTAELRPDMRAYRCVMPDLQRVHLGTYLVAHVRGAIFDAHFNTGNETHKGIWIEVFNDIQSKWVW